jgi:hypothetical protein
VRYFISLLVLVFLVMSIESLNAQNADTSSFSRKRLQGVVIAETSIYGATMLGLNQLWYKDYPREHFHFFNDNKEWLQIDKVGHSFSAYYLGLVGMEALKLVRCE